MGAEAGCGSRGCTESEDLRLRAMDRKERSFEWVFACLCSAWLCVSSRAMCFSKYAGRNLFSFTGGSEDSR